MIRGVALLVSCFLATACGGAGEGSGTVDSDHLYVENCWEGPFHLEPTFFASDPYSNTQQIRIQRGERMVSESDGVLIEVSDIAGIRGGKLNQDLDLALPIGVTPPGFPRRVDANPVPATLTLYLYDTCHLQNGALYSVGGTINFTSLFSGNRNEDEAKNRLTEATFTAVVANPRDADLVTDDSGQAVPKYRHPSTVRGSFRFYFQRGIPAQPFP